MPAESKILIPRKSYAEIVARRLAGEPGSAEELSCYAPMTHWQEWKRWFWNCYGVIVRKEFSRLGRCACCKGWHILVYTPTMTRYEDEECNRPFFLCKLCSEGYIEQMEEQWAEYNSGRL